MSLDDIIEYIIIIAIILLIIYIPIEIINSIHRDKWLSKHCKIIGKMSSRNGFGISLSGDPVITFESAKTGYQCDDGKQYWE